MHVYVIAVGKIKERGVRAWIDEYAKRIARYAAYHEIELKDGGESEVEERFRRALPARAKVVALEVNGKSYSSRSVDLRSIRVRPEPFAERPVREAKFREARAKAAAAAP